MCNICDAIKVYISKYGKVRGEIEEESGCHEKVTERYALQTKSTNTSRRRAKDTNRTIPEYIKHLMEKDNPTKGENQPHLIFQNPERDSLLLDFRIELESLAPTLPQKQALDSPESEEN